MPEYKSVLDFIVCRAAAEDLTSERQIRQRLVLCQLRVVTTESLAPVRPETLEYIAEYCVASRCAHCLSRNRPVPVVTFDSGIACAARLDPTAADLTIPSATLSCLSLERTSRDALPALMRLICTLYARPECPYVDAYGEPTAQLQFRHGSCYEHFMRVADAEALKGPRAHLQCRHSECFHRMRSKNIRMRPKASNSCNVSPQDSSVVSASKVDLPKEVEVRFLPLPFGQNLVFAASLLRPWK
ncbi:hypothetical protein NA56DRAFT_705532 [Hyaloscypha hepaticicola]|uniref:Uncharacterized protein n=1 Tax=Hyaloscypha hepaticicola TaxID=2082293 RepID=A0A2J6PZ85_9HELO|nr:hypothetical protein NA56DRAFT_705532 [Hyaloscypha hepaticicola]